VAEEKRDEKQQAANENFYKMAEKYLQLGATFATN
jgi:hypothetical protein